MVHSDSGFTIWWKSLSKVSWMLAPEGLSNVCGNGCGCRGCVFMSFDDLVMVGPPSESQSSGLWGGAVFWDPHRDLVASPKLWLHACLTWTWPPSLFLLPPLSFPSLLYLDLWNRTSLLQTVLNSRSSRFLSAGSRSIAVVPAMNNDNWRQWDIAIM